MGEVLETVARGPGALRRETGDQQLRWVLASQGGDTVAFNRLVLKWQEKIYNLSLRLLHNPEDAAEATQETFLSAYRNVRRFRLDSQFSTWLYRIASNECLSRLRKRSLRNHESLDDEALDEGPGVAQSLLSQEDQEEDLYRSERQRQVRRALRSLPHDERLAVELKFFQECTFDQIAEILDTPTSTVKSRFYKGLRSLKDQLTVVKDLRRP